MSLDSPILCYVTDSQALGGDVTRLRGVIERAVAVGVDWIQIREKQMPTQELLEFVRAVLPARTHSAGGLQTAPQIGEPGSGRSEDPPLQSRRARIIVNDRVDVALAAGADGVHLGGSSMPVGDVVGWLERERKRLGLVEDFLVGASCHSLEEAQQAERDGASYVVFGPVYATPSKAQYGAPQGVERLREVCAAVRVPVLAIGGINLTNAAECLRGGAAGVAAIRLFQEAADVAAVVEQLRRGI